MKLMLVGVKYPRAPIEFIEIPHLEGCEEYKKLIRCEVLDYVSHPAIKDVYILCDDVGKLVGLSPNFRIPEYRDIIVGTAVFVGVKHGVGEYKESDFCGLSKKQVKELIAYLNWEDVLI